MPSERQLSLAIALAIWAVLSLAAGFYGTRLGYGGRAFAFTLGVFAFLLVGEIVVAAANVRERIAGLFGSRGAIALALLPPIAYLIYALGTNTLTWWRGAIAAAYTLAPPLLLIRARQRQPGVWEDYAAVLLLWLPVKLRWLRHLWPYPDERLSYILTVLLAVNVGIVAFLFVRRLDGTGYTIAWVRGWGRAVIVNFALFVPIAIPLGQAIGFIRFEPAYAQVKTLPLTALGIFLFTTWPEEFLFRGLVQSILSRTLGSANAGWFAAAAIFGLAHINNNGVFPNWRYALLATIAGIFYGRAWRSTGSIFVSAIVHMLVDTSWHLIFRTS